MAIWHGFHGWEDDASEEEEYIAKFGRRPPSFAELNPNFVEDNKRIFGESSTSLPKQVLAITYTPSSKNGYFYKLCIAEINKIEDDEDFTQGHS